MGDDPVNAAHRGRLRLIKTQNESQPSASPSRYLITHTEQRWRGPIIRRLNELVGLQSGWDGYEGVPVTFENAYFAVEMLNVCCSVDDPIPQIVPGVSGDLQIEWHLENGDIELHILAPNNVQAWYVDVRTGLEGEEVSLTNDFAAVVMWLKNLTEPTRAIVATAS